VSSCCIRFFTSPLAATSPGKSRLFYRHENRYYRSSIQDEGSKKRYLDKLKLIGGLDPYETDKKEWKDDVDLWPCITHVHIGMYLLITPSPYTGEQLLPNPKEIVM